MACGSATGHRNAGCVVQRILSRMRPWPIPHVVGSKTDMVHRGCRTMLREKTGIKNFRGIKQLNLELEEGMLF